MKPYKSSVLLLLLLVVAACQPQPPAQSVPLPTLAQLPSPTPPAFGLDHAEQVVREYLEAWQRNDFETMHRLTTFASQEATPLSAFTTLYESSHITMSLESLSYNITSALRETNTIAVFNYDMHFQTTLVGDFNDTNRSLRAVFNPQDDQWRIAWSPADVFAQMGSGGRLRLEPRIPARANIYAGDGSILADQNGSVVSVNIIKRDVPDMPTCLASLAVSLNRSATDIETFLAQRGDDWLTEVGTITATRYLESRAQLEADCRARFEDRPARRYVNGTLAPHIIGYVGYPDEAQIPALRAAGFPQDSIIGQSGIERSWDSTLRGTPGGRLMVVSPNGTQTLLAEVPSAPSESVWLTIQPDLQTKVRHLIEQAYAEAAAGWATTSRGAAAVVMDIETGAILAMVSYPLFDSNAFTPFPYIGPEAAAAMIRQVEENPARPQLNRATLGVYPAGSIFKVVSAIAIADSGVYELDERYACSGVWRRDITRYDWLAGGHGTLTLAGGLINSCNPYFYEVGYQLDIVDPYILPNYSRRLGLGAVSGLNDLAEAPGLIPDPDWAAMFRAIPWSYSDSVNVAIGQGEVGVTPLQMARLTAIIARDGELIRPQLVEKVGILGEAPSFVMEPEILGDADIGQDVLDLVKGAMCAVTSEWGGTAEHIFRFSPRLQEIGICGKTGTAQNTPNPMPHAWFIAYAPRDNPQIAVAVMVENAGDGSAVAAPLTRDIMEYYFFGETP